MRNITDAELLQYRTLPNATNPVSIFLYRTPTRNNPIPHDTDANIFQYWVCSIPYIPKQLPGLLGAIKGAAEYEKLVLDAYGKNIPMRDAAGNPVIGPDGEPLIPGKYLEGIRRMGPQLVAHLLMIMLIVAGNIIFFIDRKRESQA